MDEITADARKRSEDLVSGRVASDEFVPQHLVTAARAAREESDTLAASAAASREVSEKATAEAKRTREVSNKAIQEVPAVLCH